MSGRLLPASRLLVEMIGEVVSLSLGGVDLRPIRKGRGGLGVNYKSLLLHHLAVKAFRVSRQFPQVLALLCLPWGFGSRKAVRILVNLVFTQKKRIRQLSKVKARRKIARLGLTLLKGLLSSLV